MQLIYYGTEQVKGSKAPEYQKALWAYNLKEGENEQEVRKRIEERCKKNPNHLVEGDSEFHWIT